MIINHMKRLQEGTVKQKKSFHSHLIATEKIMIPFLSINLIIFRAHTEIPDKRILKQENGYKS